MRNATAAVSADLYAGGYLGTGRHRLYSLTPEHLPHLEWLPAVRAGMTVFDALGALHPGA